MCFVLKGHGGGEDLEEGRWRDGTEDRRSRGLNYSFKHRRVGKCVLTSDSEDGCPSEDLLINKER